MKEIQKKMMAGAFIELLLNVIKKLQQAHDDGANVTQSTCGVDIMKLDGEPKRKAVIILRKQGLGQVEEALKILRINLNFFDMGEERYSGKIDAALVDVESHTNLINVALDAKEITLSLLGFFMDFYRGLLQDLFRPLVLIAHPNPKTWETCRLCLAARADQICLACECVGICGACNIHVGGLLNCPCCLRETPFRNCDHRDHGRVESLVTEKNFAQIRDGEPVNSDVAKREASSVLLANRENPIVKSLIDSKVLIVTCDASPSRSSSSPTIGLALSDLVSNNIHSAESQTWTVVQEALKSHFDGLLDDFKRGIISKRATEHGIKTLLKRAGHIHQGVVMSLGVFFATSIHHGKTDPYPLFVVFILWIDAIYKFHQGIAERNSMSSVNGMIAKHPSFKSAHAVYASQRGLIVCKFACFADPLNQLVGDGLSVLRDQNLMSAVKSAQLAVNLGLTKKGNIETEEIRKMREDAKQVLNTTLEALKRYTKIGFCYNLRHEEVNVGSECVDKDAFFENSKSLATAGPMSLEESVLGLATTTPFKDIGKGGAAILLQTLENDFHGWPELEGLVDKKNPTGVPTVEKPKGSPTCDEVKAMQLWTLDEVEGKDGVIVPAFFRCLGNFSSKQELMDDQEIRPFLNGYLSLITGLLKKMDPYNTNNGVDLELFRGIDQYGVGKAQNKYKKGKLLSFITPMATTSSLDVALGFAGPDGALLILKDVENACSIKAFSPFPEEEEVLVEPFSLFTVEESLKFNHKYGCHVIIMRQVIPESGR